MGTSSVSMGKSLFSPSLEPFSITQLQLHVIGSCKVKETNQSMAVARKQSSMQLIAWPGTVVPISEGTEDTIVTEYVPFRYFTRTVSMETSSIMPCYDVERLETKTHVGLGPGESI